jgi:hypothetical protein
MYLQMEREIMDLTHANHVLVILVHKIMSSNTHTKNKEYLPLCKAYQFDKKVLDLIHALIVLD